MEVVVKDLRFDQIARCEDIHALADESDNQNHTRIEHHLERISLVDKDSSRVSINQCIHLGCQCDFKLVHLMKVCEEPSSDHAQQFQTT